MLPLVRINNRREQNKGGREGKKGAATKLVATERASSTNGSRTGVMRCDCPGCQGWKEQNGRRPPRRGESAADCLGKNCVNDHWKGQGNLAAARREDCLQRGGGEQAGLDLAPTWGLSTASSSRLSPHRLLAVVWGSAQLGEPRYGEGQGQRRGLRGWDGFALAPPGLF